MIKKYYYIIVKEVDKMHESLPKLDFNLTNRCNFRCHHCCFDSGEKQMGEFSLEKIEQVVQDFKNLGGQRIDLTGGEPLVREDLPEIIKICQSLKLKTELVTNGSLLDDQKLKMFKDLGLEGIAISLDGSSYGVYREIRPVSREIFDQVLANIARCKDYGFYTKINTVVFQFNFDHLAQITRQCIKLGVDEQGFYFFTPVGRGVSRPQEVVDPIYWLNLVRQELNDFKDKIKLSLETPLIESSLIKGRKNTCYLENPWHLQILPDGKVYPCAMMAYHQHPCGDLHKQSLEEIWHDQKLWDGRYYRENVQPKFDQWGSCVDFGPRFKKMIDSGRYQPLCLVSKLTPEQIAPKEGEG